jgi:methylated-DNA-protein-cysteine methyltransferase-like protein
MNDFAVRVTAVLAALGEGEVVSYGDVAEVAGFPGRWRAVGALLAGADGDDLPWWRVVRSDGRLATEPSAGQAELLRAEGVLVIAGRVRRAPAGRFRRDEATVRSMTTSAGT